MHWYDDIVANIQEYKDPITLMKNVSVALLWHVALAGMQVS